MFDSHTVAVTRVSNLPKQANLCDCGLFVLTYIEFFCACLPDTITAAAKGKKFQVDLRGMTGMLLWIGLVSVVLHVYTIAP